MTKKYPCSKTCIHYHVCRYAGGYTQTPCKYEEHFTSINTGINTFIAEDMREGELND